MKEILKKENDYVSININENCEAILIDKTSGTEWKMGPMAFQEEGKILTGVAWERNERSFCDFYSGHFKAEKQGDDLRITLMGPPNDKTMGSFSCKVILDDKFIEFKVYDIDECLNSLVFPTPIESDSLVIPSGIGKWQKKDQPAWECFFLLQNGGMNMRWIGGLKEDEKHGWMAIMGADYADTGFYTNNLSVSPAWLKSKGKWGEKRSVRYYFTSGGYVGLAKIFRQYAKDTGIFKSLKEKIKEVPSVKNLLGGRILSFFQCSTIHEDFYINQMLRVPQEVKENHGKVDVKISHAEVAAVIKEAKEWGMKKGVFNLRGTFNGGYDENHPDIWPPEPALGTVDELKNIIAENQDPYTVVLHDNYQDIYQHSESFPNGVVKDERGNLMPGGPWHGGLCYINCPTAGFEYAKRNWENLKTLGLTGYFIDTASCVQFYECYDEEHPLTRNEDWQTKRKLMQFFKEQGLVLGSENAADFGAADLDFLENRHEQVPGETIPLWNLVFHDAAFSARYGTNGTSGGEPVRMLENMLWGYAAFWPVNNLADWRRKKQAFIDSLYVDEWHEKVGMDEMTNHKYLTEDGNAEQTEFSSGHAIIANFADEDRIIEGKTIKAQGYLILS